MDNFINTLFGPGGIERTLNGIVWGIPAMILAVLIAFSRLYLYVHYPTDVIFSVFAGILFAFIGDALAAKVAPKLPQPKRGKYETR